MSIIFHGHDERKADRWDFRVLSILCLIHLSGTVAGFEKDKHVLIDESKGTTDNFSLLQIYTLFDWKIVSKHKS